MIQSRRAAGASRRRLRVEDNRREMRLSAFERAQGEPGFRFELIAGEVHVSPGPDPIHQDLVAAIYRALCAARGPRQRAVFQHVVFAPRVFIDDDERAGTVPEPDLAAYVKYPPRPLRSYRGVFPALVVEVVSRLGREKDFVRNVSIYERCPAILEYWIVDPTRDAARPSLCVFCRDAGAAAFARVETPPGGVYASPRWPGVKVDLARVAVE